uniref:Secreted protein n=1 Tax=Anguilla anguilla TaxID=7936 RepID=A0A0E9QZ67_ANGAN
MCTFMMSWRQLLFFRFTLAYQDWAVNTGDPLKCISSIRRICRVFSLSRVRPFLSSRMNLFICVL